ncbi:MAG: hypothetical protein J7M20_08135 [Deltaproteobacteria bacterium]|nr:hypothetical protein [Deltaproteobacteria bacterium]
MRPEELILAYSKYSQGNIEGAEEMLTKHGLPSAVLTEMQYVHVWNVHSHFADPVNCDINKPPEKWHVVAVIPVRGQSRGIPRKALASLAGRTLLEHAVEKCRRSRYINRIIVDTDDKEIAESARQTGAETPYLRPLELATDRAILQDVHRFELYWLEVRERYFHDFFFMVSATHPLCPAQEMDNALEHLFESDAKNLATVAKHTEQGKEFFDQQGERIDIPEDAGRLYGQCGAFALWSRHPTYYLPKAVYQPLFGHIPHSLPHVLRPEYGLDIDTPLDLKLCENWLNRSRLVHTSTPSDIAGFLNASLLDKSEGTSSLGAVIWIEACDKEYFFFSRPVLYYVLKAVMEIRCFGSVILAGKNPASEAIAKDTGLKLCSKLPFTEKGQINPEAEYEIRHTLGPDIKDIVLINGRAPLLSTAFIRKFIEHYERGGRKALCSVSPPRTNPYWLKYIKNNQIHSVLEETIGFRQELPQTMHLDGVLTAYSADKGKKVEALFHLPQNEALIIRDKLDLIRAITISNESGNPFYKS